MSGTTLRPLRELRFVPAHPDSPAEAMACALVNSGAIHGCDYTAVLAAQGFERAEITRHIGEATTLAYRAISPVHRPGSPRIQPAAMPVPPLVAALRIALEAHPEFAS